MLAVRTPLVCPPHRFLPHILCEALSVQYWIGSTAVRYGQLALRVREIVRGG